MKSFSTELTSFSFLLISKFFLKDKVLKGPHPRTYISLAKDFHSCSVLGLAPAQPCLALKDKVGAKPEGHSEPASIHQHAIHWMPIVT
jgi:hypothetical protein